MHDCRCVSPDAPTNPVVYWLGLFDTAQTEFLINKSKGPYRLDLGDVMYAPNIQTDKLVRALRNGSLALILACLALLCRPL